MGRLFQIPAGAILFAASAMLTPGQASHQPTLISQFPDHIGKLTAGPVGSPILRTVDENKVLTEAGLVEVESRPYAGGGRNLTVTLYRFRDPSGAYEGLTYLEKDHPASAAPPSGVAPGSSLFQVGNLVVEVAAGKALAEPDRAAVAERIRKHADSSPLPPIRMYLADEHRVVGSERYALGPEAFRAATASLGLDELSPVAAVAGFSSGAEAIFSRYRAGGQGAVLLLIDYPTPQLAELHLKHLQAIPSVQASGASVERRGSLLSLVLKPSSDTFGSTVRDGIRYQTEVTWNEPGATATDPPWVTVLSRIFIGTGVFMVIAVVLGVAFGGVRVVTKIFFPGKVFDRADQMEILQLGLSAKPIQHRDFY
jgi:hypothetical protein